MSQVSYGTITITDTNDIERIYMVYAGSDSSTVSPDANDFNIWKTDITQTSGSYIWQRAVVKKSGIEITSTNFQQFYGDPICVTGEGGRGIKSITTYYCNYGMGTPDKNYSGWNIETPEYDENKPNYWIKTIIIYVDDSEEEFSLRGGIASIEDGEHKQVTSLSVALEPIQDLHGYDKPWSGGNGKNKIYITDNNSASKQRITITGTEGNLTMTSTGNYGRAGYSANVVIGQTYTFSVDITKTATSGTNSSLYLDNGLGWDANYRQLNIGTAVSAEQHFSVTFTANTDIFMAGFYVTAGANYGDTLVVKNARLEVGSTETTYSPYSNICPISGHTECVTSVCGKNLCAKYTDRTENNGVEYTVTDEGIRIHGTATASSYSWIGTYSSYDEFPIHLKAGTYKFSVTDMVGANQLEAYVVFMGKSRSGADLGNVVVMNGTTTSVTKTFTEEVGLRYGFYVKNGLSFDKVVKVQIEVGSVKTDYVPYIAPTTYTTPFGQTVYGGMLDVVSGVLTVTHGYADLGTLNWSKNGTRMQATLDDSAITGFNYNVICSQYVADSAIATVNPPKDGIMGRYQARILIHDSRYTDPTAFKTAMSGVQLVYELATPQTYQLSPQEVQLLLGTNNVWSDGGEVEVSGFTIIDRDIQIHFDSALTKAIADSAEANKNAALANSIAQSANENANGAMSQAAANIQTIVRLWYAKANSTAPAAPITHVTTSSATTYNAWNIKRPNANDSYPYYFYCDETCTGGGVYSWSEVTLDTSNLSQYQIGALTTKVKNFWWDSNGAHVASGKNGNEVTTNTISTYGYHGLMGLAGISFNYDGAKVVDLNSTTPSLDFYQPPTISGSTVTQGKKTMMLSANALTFYDPSNGTTEQAKLNTNGLVLKKGGITGGTFTNQGTNNRFVYLSTEDYGTTISINGHSASNWRQIIGTKFGVDNEGNLYASNAEISGKITASSLTIGSGATVSGLSTSNISGINNYALQSSLDTEVAQRKAVYAVSTTGATTAAKTTESGTPAGFVLYNGATVTVKFNSANSTTTPTLNVNGTGAKTIKSYTGAALTAAEYTWPAGAAITFTYDGSYWRMQDSGALQAKADAAASATTASSQASAASTSATNASNAKTAAESAKTAAQTAQGAAESAKTAAQTAQTAAETAKGQAQTAASNASQSETNAAASATAAAEVMGGFTILWNYSAFGTSTAGDAFICGFDPATGTKSDGNGWIKWNGTKRTITKQQVNPGTIVPYNIPIHIVCRLSSATGTTGTNYMVWYNAGWKYAACPSPTAVGGSWTWTDNRDIILGSFVETGANEVLTECELFNPPWTSKQITTNTTTPTSYIMDTDSNKGITVKPKDSSGNDFLQMNSTAIEFFRNSTTTSVMRLTDSSFRLGLEASNHTTIDTNGLHIWAGTESTATNEVALFSTTARIGKTNNSRFLMNASSLQAYNSSNVKYFEVSASGMTYGTNTVASTSYADGKASAAQTAAEATAQGYANTAEANASYSVEIEVSSIDFVNNNATLVAHPYFKGVKLTDSTTPALSTITGYSWSIVDGTAIPSGTITNAKTLQLPDNSNLSATYVCTISKT